jgi:DNA-binding transcriptional ArsR family regulator
MTGVKLMRRRDGEELLDPDFVRAIGHPIRIEILLECNAAPICVSEFRERRRPGIGRQAVEKHFAILADCGAIEEVDSRREKGGRARFYAASTRGAFFDEEDFERIPAALRGSLTASLLCSTLTERVQEAALAGTLEAHPERHLSWTPMKLDLAGFLALVEELDGIFSRLTTLEAEAAERMTETGEEPMHVTLAMLGFESPAPFRDHQVEARYRSP